MQRSVLSEGLSASSTRVWFFSRVNSHILCQMLFLHERLWTVLAFVGFVAPVDHFISPQTKRRTEALSAGVTGVKPGFLTMKGYPPIKFDRLTYLICLSICRSGISSKQKNDIPSSRNDMSSGLLKTMY